jgi:hypothetical protein
MPWGNEAPAHPPLSLASSLLFGHGSPPKRHVQSRLCHSRLGLSWIQRTRGAGLVLPCLCPPPPYFCGHAIIFVNPLSKGSSQTWDSTESSSPPFCAPRGGSLVTFDVGDIEIESDAASTVCHHPSPPLNLSTLSILARSHFHLQQWLSPPFPSSTRVGPGPRCCALTDVPDLWPTRTDPQLKPHPTSRLTLPYHYFWLQVNDLSSEVEEKFADLCEEHGEALEVCLTVNPPPPVPPPVQLPST